MTTIERRQEIIARINELFPDDKTFANLYESLDKQFEAALEHDDWYSIIQIAGDFGSMTRLQLRISVALGDMTEARFDEIFSDRVELL